MTDYPTVEGFDCVKFMREQRDRLSKEMAGRSHEEFLEWLDSQEYTDPTLRRWVEKCRQARANPEPTGHRMHATAHAMKLMRYPRYRPSGVESLGDVPEHWKVTQLGQLGHFFKGSGGTLRDKTSAGVPCVRYGDIYTTYDYHVRTGIGFVSELRASQYTSIHYGDVLFAGSGETIDDIGKSVANLLRVRACCGGDVIVLRPATGMVDPVYSGYAIDTVHASWQKTRMGRGVTVMHIYASDLKYLTIAIPPASEQVAIATYLDRETAQIDALIGKNKILVERLKEQRTALISQAVTRGLPPDECRKAGLNPNPKLKPSGVEWLGDVPEHWRVRRLKYLASVNDEVLPEATDPDYKMQYVDISDVDSNRGIHDLEHTTFGSAPSRARRIVRHGDTIISTVRTYLRAIAPIRQPAPNTIVSTGFAVLRPKSSFASSYAYYALTASGFIDDVVARSVGANYPAISANEIGNIAMAVPPQHEQHAIAGYLDGATAKIDTLIELARQQGGLLQEYRTRLITDAVTGKIDVREVVDVSEEVRT